jgi:hypothetical protein
MIHGRNSSLAVFLEVYSMSAIQRRAIKPAAAGYDCRVRSEGRRRSIAPRLNTAVTASLHAIVKRFSRSPCGMPETEENEMIEQATARPRAMCRCPSSARRLATIRHAA